MRRVQLSMLADRIAEAMRDGPQHDDARLWVVHRSAGIYGCPIASLRREGQWGESWVSLLNDQIRSGTPTALVAHGYRHGDQPGFGRGCGVWMWVPDPVAPGLLSGLPAGRVKEEVSAGGHVAGVVNPDYLESLQGLPRADARSFEIPYLL